MTTVQSNKRSAEKSKTVNKVTKVAKVKVIKKAMKMPVINLTPRSNWMIVSAYIEPQSATLYAGKEAPTFLNMQQVFAIGPRVTDVEVGDWVYIDMTRFIKTIKKKSTIRAGVGGEDMISEQLVPPVFAAPGDDTVFLKINDMEIEGVIIDPSKLKKEYSTLEEFAERQERMEAEATDGRRVAAEKAFQASLKNNKDDGRKGPMIITETSPTR